MSWQDGWDLNPQPTVLETATLPIELPSYTSLTVTAPDKKGGGELAPRSRFESLGLKDFGYASGTDGAATFADREAQTFFHRDRLLEFNVHRHVVAGHDHFHTGGQV